MTWALITGASRGLGKEFATQLAERGHSLVLVARTTHALDAIAGELRGAGTEVVVKTVDLASAAERDQLAGELDAEGIVIDVLVNNAGFGTVGDFVTTDADTLGDEVEVNVAALAHLCRVFAPAMVEVGSGSIINVASTAAFQPVPGMALYAATKSFVLSFSQALWSELKPHGVKVIALCPGPTDTAFFHHAGDDGVMTRRRTPEQAVSAAFKGLDRGVPHVVDGALNAVQAAVAKAAPARIAIPVARAVARRGE
ncbi:MAG TPA: SDR family oxidoreductase [Propionibacteriaceae bacterium]|nr:SDR family oxidoreductase [Propionibacteriaceae bacterium]